MKLSICMMVKDEEKNLKRCLESLAVVVNKGLAELIIVDTGSTDKTVEIAKEYTPNIYFHKWNKHFSEMRNKSISYASGEWILIIDADECLDNADELCKLLESNKLRNYKTGVAKIKNLDNYEDNDKYNIMASPRLFKNDGTFRYDGAVHNQPIYKKPVLNTDVSLRHYGYIVSDKELMEKKYHRTVELLQTELVKKPEDLYYLYQLGVSYNMHADHEDALKQFRKAYDIMNRKKLLRSGEYNYILASHVAVAYANKEMAEAIEIAKIVISTEPEYVDMYYILGLAEQAIKNQEESVGFFSKYLKFVKKYNSLNISKDLSVIMYYINETCISNAYKNLAEYYLGQKNYKKLYEIYESISDINCKINCAIETLLELEKYQELNKFYLNLKEESSKNIFLFRLEESIKCKDLDKQIVIYKTFMDNEDDYSLLNKIRMEEDEKAKIRYIDILMNKLDIIKAPVFYLKTFLYLENNMDKVIKYLITVDSYHIRKIIQYIINEDKEFALEIKQYISNENKEELDLATLKVSLAMMAIVLTSDLEVHGDIAEENQIIFKKYINTGISFVKQIYQVNKAEYIYTNISVTEDRFFVLMYLVEKSLGMNDKKQVINYILEAAKVYPVMVKYINQYKDEIFEKEINKDEGCNEFEQYKAKIKENINMLTTNGQIDGAKALIREYKGLVPEDIDNYSMDAVIAIIEGKIEDAKAILGAGLEKEPNNYDLNFNMKYITEIEEEN